MRGDHSGRRGSPEDASRPRPQQHAGSHGLLHWRRNGRRQGPRDIGHHPRQQAAGAHQGHLGVPEPDPDQRCATRLERPRAAADRDHRLLQDGDGRPDQERERHPVRRLRRTGVWPHAGQGIGGRSLFVRQGAAGQSGSLSGWHRGFHRGHDRRPEAEKPDIQEPRIPHQMGCRCSHRWRCSHLCHGGIDQGRR